MKFFSKLLLVLLFAFSSQAFAGDKDPLFVNLTTNEVHASKMALVFSAKQQEKGHPLTIFLNNDGVTLANTTIARFAEHQKIISDAISKGATIIICPMCMKYFGVKEADIVKGLTIGSPDITGAALFKDNTKTLSW